MEGTDSGPANGAWQVPGQNATQLPMRPRLPTVEEALKFSPLTSIVPFHPDIIPLPSTHPPPPSDVLSTNERLSQRKELDSLNAEASNQSTSARIEQTLKQLQHLLRPNDLTEYKFKRPSGYQPAAHEDSNGTPLASTSPDVGPFSKMLIKHAKVPFRYPSPPSPPPSSKKKEPPKKPEQVQAKGQATQRTPTPLRPDQQVNVQAVRQNHSISPQASFQQPPNKSTPVPLPRTHSHSSSHKSSGVSVVIPAKSYRDVPAASLSSQSPAPTPSAPRGDVNKIPRAGFSVVIPGLPPSSQKEDYQSFPDEELLLQEQVKAQQQKFPSGPSVIIPGLPASSQKEEYKHSPEADARALVEDTGLSKKRKREDDEEDERSLALMRDQRAKAEAAAQNLKALIGDIFEAEDQMQPDSAGDMPSNAAQYFMRNYGDGDLPFLSSQTQARLDSAMYKVISAKAFGRIEVDSLSRLQKLCEGAARSVGGLSLTLGEDWSENDIEEWVGRLQKAEHGLQAARILLRIMTAGREEKQLYSEDLLSNVLEAIKHVLETCLVPVIETRNTDSSSVAFRIYMVQKKPLSALLTMAGKVLRLLSELITKTDVSDTAITSVEFLSSTLIFVENAHIEKESALGIQKCEGIRRIAMDVLAKIFARYPDQRTFIFDEILTSLEKLPVTRQSARQFKMVDGKPIQLVSALLMRLVQTSATRTIRDTHKDIKSLRVDEEVDDDASPAAPRSPPDQSGIIDMADAAGMDYDESVRELGSLMKPLFDTAHNSTRYLVNFMVQRAMKATKTGDQPYRNLLDIFTEDFLSVLGHPDWPAAELLLRTLLSNMISLAESDKSSAPAKNMALDVMGLLGSGISDLQMHVKSAIKSIDTSESDLARKIAQIAEDVMDDKFEDLELLEFDGPYRAVLEYLDARDVDDPQLQSAKGYHATQWAKEVHGYMDKDEDETMRPELAIQLRNILSDPSWLQQEYDFERVLTAQGNLAGAVVALRLPFCKAFKRIVGILLSAMTSDQATVKSRSLKSVVQLLDKDPSILRNGNYIINQILRCSADQSPLVRDSALGLLGKCLQYKPSLEDDVCDRIVARSQDAAVGVRKRAMKLLKDVYLRNKSKEVKTAIAEALLLRIKDMDESVAELARTTFEEIWFAPFYGTSNKDAAQSKLELSNHVTLLINTVQRGESVLSVFDGLLETVLSNSSKNAAANFNVCKNMVALMFDGVIDSSDLPESPAQVHIMQTLTVFAKASPRLFTADQLQTLQPYVQNLTNTDDLLIYRSVIVIFRHTLPSLSTLQNTFLKAVQDALLVSVSKLGKMELNEVAQCLWIIDGVLQNTDRLVRMLVSCITGVHNCKESDLSDENPKKTQNINRVKRYMMIAGYFGKSCNFDDQVAGFKEKYPWWKGNSVAGLIVEVLRPFTRQKVPEQLREMAFESIGLICQEWPTQFLRTDVSTSFELVFHNRESKLEQIILASFKSFYAKQERRSETGANIKVGQGAARGSERLQVSLVASDDDGACSGIAQRFLQHIIRIALEPDQAIALTATQVIASINRQGLVHPKECGPALVALETSTHPLIADIAFQEHRSLHHKHESMFEKEYMKAVQRAFTFQREIFNDTHGATTQPFASKLRPLFEVLKTGNPKVRRKFLLNLSSRANFDFSKADFSKDTPEHLLFARFCLENLAFFEYVRVDELLALLSNLEKIFSNTGTPVAHAIETDVLKYRLDEAAPVPTIEQPPHQHALQPVEQHANHAFPQLQENPRQPLAQPPAQPLALPAEPTMPGVESNHASAGQPEAAPKIEQESSLPEVSAERLRHLTVCSIILTMLWETRTHLRRYWGLQKQREAQAKGGNGDHKPTVKDLNKAPNRTPGVTGDKFWERMNSLMASLESPDKMKEQCKAFAELLSIDNELKVASEDDDEAERVAAGYQTPDEDDESRGGSQPPSGNGRGRKRKGSVSMSATPKKRKSGGGQRGRPRKNAAGRRSSTASRDDDADAWG
ncbi:sister chromatid cohesion protein Mis4 [Phyllosticta citribraziliensis]|uniref:Sister chromatid cohesion protein n=1 Tax=Phyllosticta citribraziliensis TaxID=989973 RepID=A0ABR1LTF8_9PEZI